VISRFVYHNSATVKGGAAVAQRLKALEGERRIHFLSLPLALFFTTEPKTHCTTRKSAFCGARNSNDCL
jgi:hypothetical protein